LRTRSPYLDDRSRLLSGALSLALLATAVGVPDSLFSRADATVDTVHAVAITVSEMDTALDFYTGVLPFQVESDVEVIGDDVERFFGVFGVRARIATLRLGDERIELVDFLAPEGREVPVDSRSNDLWFQHVAIVVSDMARAYQRLRDHHVTHASTGPQRLPDWNPNAGGIEAFYFKDPDGHALEIIYFPPGKGDERWQGRDELFLGIDHTAIVVANTERSLGFYRDVLGFTVAGTSENYGTEQEHLNNVFGAHLLITGLRAPNGGPGVEFLEYLAPSDGRARPTDAGNDLVHWRVVTLVDDIDELVTSLEQRRSRNVSTGLVAPISGDLGFRSGISVRDPDGHVVTFLQGLGEHDDRAARPDRSADLTNRHGVSSRRGKEGTR